MIVALLVVSVAVLIRREVRTDEPSSTTSTTMRQRHDGGRPTPALSAATSKAGRRIAGRVTADNRPVVRARVRLVGSAALDLVTDEFGHFDFGAMPVAAYSIGAFEPGRLAEVRNIDTRDQSFRADDLELALAPCEAALFGRVTDPSGAPIAGAEVLSRDVIGVATDEQGRYKLCRRRVALENEELRTIVRATGYAAQEVVTGTNGHAYDFVLVPEVALQERADHRRDRNRQDLRRMRARATGVSQRPPCALTARRAALLRARACTCRRNLLACAREDRAGRRPRDR
jgi:hypothetical protein